MNDTEFSGEPESPSFLGSLHLPIALIALALAIGFFADLRSAGKQAEIMRWQQGNLDRQREALSSGKREFAALIVKNDDVVRQAQQIQAQYTNLFSDLIDLAKDDKDAKEIVDKWGIKRAGQPGAEAPKGDAPKTDAPAPDAPAADGKAPALR